MVTHDSGRLQVLKNGCTIAPDGSAIHGVNISWYDNLVLRFGSRYTSCLNVLCMIPYLQERESTLKVWVSREAGGGRFFRYTTRAWK